MPTRRGCRASWSELICDSPLPEPLDALAMKGIPEEPLREFLEHHGFRSLLARLGAQVQAAAAPTAVAGADPGARSGPSRRSTARSTRRSPTRRRSTAGSPRPSANGRVAFDTETDGRDCVTAKLVGISLATDCNKACYIPLEHGGDDLFAERPDQLPAELVLAKLKPLLEDPAILKIGHNLKFDWVVLERRGIRVAPYDDTLVMSFNLDAGGLNSHALDDLAKKHLDHDCIDLQGAVRHRAEADHLQQGAARPGHRICRRGCRRRAAAVDALPGAAAVRAGDPGLRAGRPADGRGGRRGWSATASRSTARC